VTDRNANAPVASSDANDLSSVDARASSDNDDDDTEIPDRFDVETVPDEELMRLSRAKHDERDYLAEIAKMAKVRGSRDARAGGSPSPRV